MACAASVQGTSHVKDELPCQDAHAIKPFTDPAGGEGLVAVVADGAGSATRSADGSRFVCDELAAALAATAWSTDGEENTRMLTMEVTRVRDLLVERAEAEGLPARQFACTLLCAVLTPERGIFAQLGDGVIVTPGSPSTDWMWVFWPQRGEYANSTSFLTDDSAMQRLTIDVTERAVGEIAMLTDGLQHLVLHYKSETVHSPFFERMMAPVRASGSSGVDDQLGAALTSYLTSDTVTARADDDLTLLLATRRPHEG